MNYDIDKIANDLSDKILGLLMKKTIKKDTFNFYKSKVHELILDYLKSNF